MRKAITLLGMIIILSSFVYAWYDGISYYEFENNLDDTGSYGYQETLTGTYGNFSDGKVLNSIFFNDNQILNDSSVNFTNIRTIDFWFKRSSDDATGVEDVLFEIGVSQAGDPSNRMILWFVGGNEIVWWFKSGDVKINEQTTAPFDYDKWYHIVLLIGTGGYKMYINGALNISGADTSVFSSTYDTLMFADGSYGGDYDGFIDNFFMTDVRYTTQNISDSYNSGNGKDFAVSTAAPILLDIESNGYNTSPYLTSDITPTFTFTTDINANCRIGDQDQNYTDMTSGRNCNSGDGTKSHICNLTSQDELIPPTDYVYISCENDENGNESETSSSGALQVNLTNLISNANCTSCNFPYGDNSSPYSTSDKTPSFTFTTDMNANCRIGDQDQNYTTMGSSRNCTSGNGTTSHSCTLSDIDELVTSTDYVFISCRNSEEVESNLTSKRVEVELINLISNITCKSCNPPQGSTTEPYVTSDTTPTFNFTTNMNADCRIGDESQNFSIMTSSRNCTTTGKTNHTCTIIVDDELFSSTDYIYIGCRNSEGKEYDLTMKTLQMSISNLSINNSNALDQGIQSSVVWPGAIVYTDQQVYLRNLNDNQVLGTVDRVVVYGNQRWILNVAFDNETTLGLFNISPTVYVLDLENASITNIKLKVASLINKTKN